MTEIDSAASGSSTRPSSPWTWLRSWPSGDVHALSNLSIREGVPATRCGICWPTKRWTDHYPPAARRCGRCVTSLQIDAAKGSEEIRAQTPVPMDERTTKDGSSS